ncbi:MAG TPA: deoxyribodipyrimidine photo-lyase, partial [Leclercia adecarboxylata]|nr:deoxyribodipyrimidine photo-lyase [Leclercia adecarboxylata]
MATHLVWFRADLRIHDNLALAAACRNKNARVLALFIATPQQWQQHAMAPRQAAFLHAHLNGLQQQLADKGIPLLYAQVDDFAAQAEKVAQICAEHDVTQLFYNYQYELNEQQRDRQLERALEDGTCQGFDDSVILPPGSVMTGKQE